MEFSESWLREWNNPALDSKELGEVLTHGGIEVDLIRPATPMFTGVVVAKIADIKPHPDAERLQLCEVDDGERKFTVVTAATNVAVDKRYPFAQVGSQLRTDKK